MVRAGLSLLLCFSFLSFLVVLGVLRGFDLNSLVFIQSFVPSQFGYLFSMFSLLGSFEISTLILAVLLFFLSLRYRILVFSGYVLFHVVELLGKRFIPQIGPPFETYRYKFDFLFPTSGVDPGFAYPSGHAGRTSFLSIIFLSIIYQSKLSNFWKFTFAFLLLTFDFFMFVSRIYLGEHWTTDVIGGILLGAGFSLLSLNIKTSSRILV